MEERFLADIFNLIVASRTHRFGRPLWRPALHDRDVSESDSCVLRLQAKFLSQHCRKTEERIRSSVERFFQLFLLKRINMLGEDSAAVRPQPVHVCSLLTNLVRQQKNIAIRR